MWWKATVLWVLLSMWSCYTGEKEIATGCASTDCNIPLSQGIPAVCFGGYVGHKGHTRQEFVELDSLEVGPLVVGTVITEYFQ